MPNRALVMSGGGSKGAFQLGAVDTLVNENGLDFQVIAGVSTGSLNATLLAQAGPGELRDYVRKLADVWFGIRSDEDIYTKPFLQRVVGMLALVARNSMFLAGPLERKLEANVDPEKLRRSGRELRVGGVSLESGQYRSVKGTDPSILKWTLASSSIPLMFPPVAIGNQSGVDGGVRNITPLKDAIGALKELPAAGEGAEDEIYVVLASPLSVAPTTSSWKSALTVGKRTLSILLNEVFREDLDYALAINRSVRAHMALRRRLDTAAASTMAEMEFPYAPPKKRALRIRTILPEREYSDALSFRPDAIRRAYEAGRRAAATPLDEDALQAELDR